MNLKDLTSPEVQQWIRENASKDIYTLAFQKSPFLGVPMSQLIEQIAAIQSFAKKVPFLASTPNLVFPPKINREQTSSWVTANYKAQLVNANTLADITGGFGVDCLAFAEYVQKVMHIEQNVDLQTIAEHNFKVLRKNNIISLCKNGLDFLKEITEPFDVIYADPSRRDEYNQKVFKIEDLTPNPTEIVTLGMQKSNKILLKLSPMLDLKDAVTKLNATAEIHIVSVKNELKELLLVLKKEAPSNVTVKCVNLETAQPVYTLPNINDVPLNTYSTPLKYIYEPNVSIMKSGAFNRVAVDFSLAKLGVNTHLYTSNDLVPNFPGEVFTDIQPVENPKKALKNQSVRMIQRNFPMSRQKLQQQYKFKNDGTSVVIFTSSIGGVHILSAKSLKL